MAYLTRWRMTLATHKLREKGQTLGAVALGIGYESHRARFVLLSEDSPAHVQRSSWLQKVSTCQRGNEKYFL